MVDKSELVLANLSESEMQALFLGYYREAQGKDKTIKNTCEQTGISRWIFDVWLADPDFEEKFWALRRAHSYELEEKLSTLSCELMDDNLGISKERYYALQIAQKSVLETIGKLNRERFGESSEVRIRQEGNIQPSINISLVNMQAPAGLPEPTITVLPDVTSSPSESQS